MRHAQAISARGKRCFVCSTLSAHLTVPRYTRDCGKSSSWYAEGCLLSSLPQHHHQHIFRMEQEGLSWLIITMGGMRTHREDHSQPGGFSQKTWTVAEVEIFNEQDRSQVRAATTEATDRMAAGDAATDKEAVKRRLSELHRLPNSRKGRLNATYRKNAEANDKACDLNQKSVQVLDALAKEYVDFEVTMASVTHEQEAGDTVHVATLEVAEELERTFERTKPSAG